VAALGKAAPGLAAAWLDRLPGWTTELFVLTPHLVPIPAEVERVAAVRRGAHPLPDVAGEASARELLELAHSLGADDLLVVLLSGGASALLAAPKAGLSLEDVRATTRVLLRVGAPITAVNTVRRQLLAAAGGGLARTAWPASVMTLIVSDVLGDPVPDIASGPTVSSPTGPADALGVLERFGIAEAVPGSVADFLGRRLAASPRDEARIAAGARTEIIGNNRTAVDAAAVLLRRRGYRTVTLERSLAGEAAARGRQLGGLARGLGRSEATAVVVGGETTVTVRGHGRGGRNQELALAAAIELEGAAPCALLAGATDGVDGLSDHAGAVVDPTTVARLRARGIDAAAALADNDSGSAFGGVGDALITGPTGTNVCDITVLLTRP